MVEQDREVTGPVKQGDMGQASPHSWLGETHRQQGQKSATHTTDDLILEAYGLSETGERL